MIIKLKTFSGETLYIPEEDYLNEVMYSNAARRAITKPGKTAALIKNAANGGTQSRYYLGDLNCLVDKNFPLESRKETFNTLKDTINRGGRESWVGESLRATRRFNRGAMFKDTAPFGVGKNYKKIAELRAKNQELNKLKGDNLGKYFFN